MRATLIMTWIIGATAVTAAVAQTPLGAGTGRTAAADPASTTLSYVPGVRRLR